MLGWAAGLLTSVLLLSSCTTAPARAPAHPAEPAGVGGTLRLGTAMPLNLDPQRSYTDQIHATELFRCCLLRTLLSYNGLPGAEGGGVALPDLAERMPEVSQDRLTWTFTLRSGLRYAPPFDDVPIVATDVIRGLEREARVGGNAYAFYYDVIDGFTEFAGGDADSIRGLLAPDDRTLVVQLSRPTGDFGDRIAQAGAAPIPAKADDAGARLGAAEGHDRDYASYLVASGPYMPASIPIFGSAPPAPKVGIRLDVGASIVLVRNPSWSRSSDPLRLALADRIEIHFFASQPEIEEAIRIGAVDLELALWSASPAAIDAAEASDPPPVLLYTGPSGEMVFQPMNLAVPPLDDLAVRRAINLIVDRDRIAHILQSGTNAFGFPSGGTPATHLVPDGIEGDLLSSYDPYETGSSMGAVTAARAEMARSRYDVDRDGLCDVPACGAVLAMVVPIPAYRRIGAAIGDDLALIGIELEVEHPSLRAGIEMILDPRSRLGFPPPIAWVQDYANASTFFVPLFRHPDGENNRDVSMLGATSAQLQRWGYEVVEVPTIANRIDACDRTIGDAQVRCWALLDRYLMERVAPIVPLFATTRTLVVGTRVEGLVFDAAVAGQVSLDRLRVVE